LRKDAKFLKEEAESIAQAPEKLGLKETKSVVCDLLKSRENHGDKLTKTGVALIVCPDPMTSIAGLPLLAAGVILRSRQSIAVKDVFSNLNQEMKSLSSFRLD